MKPQQGMTLLEVLVALVVFALAGLALLQTTAQQAGSIGRMEEKILASWIAENQQVRLHLEKVWPGKSWVSSEVTFAGESWHLRWQGVETADSQLRALDVEVRRRKEDAAALASVRSYMVRQ